MKGNSNMNDTVKFAFIRDPRCQERVLTVARTLVGDNIHYNYCVNKVVEVDFAKAFKNNPFVSKTNVVANAGVHEAYNIPEGHVKIYGYAVVELDRFDRKIGKLIAGGRMKKMPLFVPKDEFSPYITVLREISISGSETAARIAGEYLDYLMGEEE